MKIFLVLCLLLVSCTPIEDNRFEPSLNQSVKLLNTSSETISTYTNYSHVDENLLVDSIYEENILIGEIVQAIGIYHKEPAGCAGWCIYEKTLEGYNYGSIILVGNIPEREHEKLLKVTGTRIDYEGYNFTINVTEYEIISNFSSHEYVIEQSTQYMLDTYGCTCSGPRNCPLSHDKSISWEIEEGIVTYIVRWTMFESELAPYIELTYDIQGELIDVDDQMHGYQPCKG